MWVARHFRRRLLILSVSTLGFFISSFSAVLASDFTSRIVSILDGDTLEVLHNHRPERIRLSGIDCPEKGQADGHRAKPVGSRQRKIVLAQYRGPADPETGGSFTVKKYASEKIADAESDWRHTRITLSPLNPECQPIVLTPESEGDVQVIAEFLAVLGRA